MISSRHLIELGILPIRNGPIRFAVGDPEGLSSNSWRIWVSGNDIYIACRDNFKEAKVSLHESGLWRVAFTEESITKGSVALGPGQDRVWEKWPKPEPNEAGVVTAFRLLFPTLELGVKKEQRNTKHWEGTLFIEAGPVGKLTVITLFISNTEITVRHQSEPSFCLGLLRLENGQYLYVFAHGEPELNIKELIEDRVKNISEEMKRLGIPTPSAAYSYMLGRLDDGSRYIVGARVNR